MPTIVVKAPAKINLFLDVVGVLENGYHALDMVMQAIDLCDVITIRWRVDDRSEEKKEEISILLTCDDLAIPTDGRNTAYQAAQAFYEQVALRFGSDVLPRRIEIAIEKKIPEQAGLGGSSADAAGVLCGLLAMLKERLPTGTRLAPTEMVSLAKSIGADVPFCLMGGTAEVGGIGEVMSALPPLPEMELLIVKPVAGVSTKEAFAAYDALPSMAEGATLPPTHKEGLLTGMATGSLAQMGEHLYNALEQVCSLAEVTQIKEVMRSFGAWGAQMSGSGSAVFGIFSPHGEEIVKAEEFLRRRYATVIRCRPLSHGATVISRTTLAERG